MASDRSGVFTVFAADGRVYLPAGLAIKRGPHFVRPVFIVMALAVMARLLYVRLAR